MANCPIHPSRAGVLTMGGQSYCAQCQTGIVAASTHVGAHVEPKDCFVWYEGGSRGWQPIPGTGCAHWVMHQLNRKISGVPTCLEGFPIRVSAVTVGRASVALADVRANDIYVTPSADHTGLVLSVTPSTTAGGAATIIIRHDSSGQGHVSDNPFATYFHGRGSFYR